MSLRRFKTYRTRIQRIKRATCLCRERRRFWSEVDASGRCVTDCNLQHLSHLRPRLRIVPHLLRQIDLRCQMPATARKQDETPRPDDSVAKLYLTVYLNHVKLFFHRSYQISANDRLGGTISIIIYFPTAFLDSIFDIVQINSNLFLNYSIYNFLK